MKNIHRIIFSLFATAAVVSGLSSCERADYPDRFRPTEGVPVVHSVMYSSNGVYTEQAFMEEIVCILGENLTSVRKVFFNDQEAVLNTSFITPNTLLVAVPKTMPVVETDKLYLITRDEKTVEYGFKVLPPAPKVNEMTFEYAEPGTVTTIYGNYFYEKPDGVKLAIEFPGAEVTDIKEIAIDHVTFTIPEGAQPGRVKVTTASGTSASAFMYKDNRGLLFDFDGTNGLYTTNQGWHPQKVASEGGFSGNYLQLGDGATPLAGDGSDWNDALYHFEYWAGTYKELEDYGTWDGRRLIDIVDFTAFNTMVIKFEINISADTPWKGTPMQLIFAPVSLVSNSPSDAKDIYGVTLGGQNNTYFHDEAISLPRAMWEPWKATGSYDTNGEWVTVTIPVSDFVYYWDGKKATGNLLPESFSNLEIFVAAGDGSGASSAPLMKIDNVRAVPAK